MARFEDMERHRAAREREAAALRHNAITRYGETLGEAYLGYAHGQPSTFEEQAQQRATFAEAIVNVLENGTHDERVQGMTALLGSFEAKIAPVARQASDADMRTATIG
jgi:hypothetical protein